MSELEELLEETLDQVKRLRAEVATHRAALDQMDETFQRIARSPYFAAVALAQRG